MGAGKGKGAEAEGHRGKGPSGKGKGQGRKGSAPHASRARDDPAQEQAYSDSTRRRWEANQSRESRSTYLRSRTRPPKHVRQGLQRQQEEEEGVDPSSNQGSGSQDHGSQQEAAPANSQSSGSAPSWPPPPPPPPRRRLELSENPSYSSTQRGTGGEGGGAPPPKSKIPRCMGQSGLPLSAEEIRVPKFQQTTLTQQEFLLALKSMSGNTCCACRVQLSLGQLTAHLQSPAHLSAATCFVSRARQQV